MPLYEYQCTEGHTFEVRKGFSESVFICCPKCQHIAARTMSNFSFTFKDGKPSNEGVSKVNPKARRVRV